MAKNEIKYLTAIKQEEAQEKILPLQEIWH